MQLFTKIPLTFFVVAVFLDFTVAAPKPEAQSYYPQENQRQKPLELNNQDKYAVVGASIKVSDDDVNTNKYSSGNNYRSPQQQQEQYQTSTSKYASYTKPEKYSKPEPAYAKPQQSYNNNKPDKKNACNKPHQFPEDNFSSGSVMTSGCSDLNPVFKLMTGSLNVSWALNRCAENTYAT
ncbi:unnamed protein product [Notodromas monacha]|uniref:Secreted protein n=1 Tax=Notodromas monacha TaxID=399045 RepID=A0A7R9BDI3_9CRUS|nr:unnamed protein product [Notodromas monacha]CAG0913333.1 unnamed protein product [Notodromas monacha]